jgi:hypothetical protein
MSVLGKDPRPRAATLTVLTVLAIAGCAGSHTTDRASCPTTKPGGPRPPRFALLNFGNQIASPTDPTLYGNGVLWTGIPSPAWSVWDPRTRMIGIKMGWFRARPGRVTLTAKPLDGPPARFTGQVGTPAEYGPTGFAASGLAFGRPGCWKLHASLAMRELTIVLDVRPGNPAQPGHRSVAAATETLSRCNVARRGCDRLLDSYTARLCRRPRLTSICSV